MSNSYFQFKQFTIHHDRCAMKVTTDSCLFGAWVAAKVQSSEFRVGSRESGVGSSKLSERNILDIGAGTGLLSLMMAQKNKLPVHSLEIDNDSFEQATENIAASPWKDRIKIFHTDARKFQTTAGYSYIISNPPFYEKEWKSDNDKKNLAHHDEGLLLPELLTIIRKQLEPAGYFYIMLPYKRNEAFKKLIADSDLSISQLTFVRPSTGHNYFRVMVEGSFKKNTTPETAFDEIAITKQPSPGIPVEYTPAFVHLLKDYYLYL